MALLWRAALFHSCFCVYLKICHIPEGNSSWKAITIYQTDTPEELE